MTIRGDKAQVTNYRPIAFLCIVSKFMEIYTCIYNSVDNVAEPLNNTLQHGYMTG